MNSGQNKLDSTLTGMWVNFFTTAGIPSDVAATYALTFTENRIQNDMLLDLNKEYLRDMGITRMGDVIAILRHAKVVHESTARDRVLSSAASGNKVPVAAVTGRSTSAQASSPASRMLEHYTRNHPAAAGQSPDGSPTRAPAPKRKSLETGSSEAGLKKARLIRFGSAGSLPQKVTSEVTTSKNVFSRLGNSDPSIPVLTKTVPIKNVSIRPETTRPIFARLGSKTASEESIEPIPKDALKYEGILKSDPLAKKTFTVTTSKSNTRKIAVGMGCTMRADEAPVSVKEKLALPLVKSVKFSNKVEYKEIEAVQKVVQAKPKFNSVFNKPERRLSMPEDNSIKSRLGLNARLSTAKGLTTTKELTATSTKGLTTTSTKGLNTIKGLTTKDLNTSKGLSKAKPKNVNNFTITRNVFNRLGI